MNILKLIKFNSFVDFLVGEFSEMSAVPSATAVDVS